MVLILVKNKVKLFIQNNFSLLEEGLREVNYPRVSFIKGGIINLKHIHMKISFLIGILFLSIISRAHDSNHEHSILRTWKTKDNKKIEASFYLQKEGKVYLEDSKGKILSFSKKDLSNADQMLIDKKQQKIDALNHQLKSNVNHSHETVNSFPFIFLLCLIFGAMMVTYLWVSPNKRKYIIPIYAAGFITVIVSFTTKKAHQLKSLTNPAELEAAFKPFKSTINTRYDETYFYVESNGIATTHEMMVGISSNGWQQQVPVPQCYIGSNAWSIPLNPEVSSNPIPVNADHFSRGAIALAINGIPIFNPYTNTGVDAFLDGQLDAFGGHSGRADDYHYHTAPLHLYAYTDATKPIAYGLDGYAVYGEKEPDGSTMKTLDVNHGHYGENGVYHYHGESKAPYMIGNMVGKVTEDATKQLIPQAAATSIRPSLTPLKGAVITSLKEHTDKMGYTLKYNYNGGIDSLEYHWDALGNYTYNYHKQAGFTTASYKKFAPCIISNQVSMINEISSSNLKIYPIPAIDIIHLKLDNSKMESAIIETRIISLNGKIEYQSKGFQNSINVQKMDAGIYLIELLTPDFTYSKKIIVQ